jgi:hypothetical protein
MYHNIQIIHPSSVLYTEIFENGNATLLRWAMNNISNYHNNKEPLIGQVTRVAQELGWPTSIPDTVEMTLTPPAPWNYTENVTAVGGPGPALGTHAQAIVSLTKGQVIELVLQNARALNGAAEYHPWHAHGHSFWVVGRGEGIYNPETDVATYNLENPVLRDTASLQPLGWVALRLLVDNPGAWYFHCHIVAHQYMGMGFVLVVQPDEIEGTSDNVRFCDKVDNAATNDSDTTDSETSTGNSTSSEGLKDSAKSSAHGSWMKTSSFLVMVCGAFALIGF